jgi:radical SAM superfamily enzyme YgiQ (UPF0313 family)
MMASKRSFDPPSNLPSESGTIRKSWKHRLRVALAYPNVYAVGMANLGFQTVYRLFNQIEHVVCERVFVPDRDMRPQRPAVSLESGRPLTDFDIVAFSISFENDYPHLLTLLAQGGLPLHSHERTERHPLVLAGGVACFLNPEPLSAFVDVFLLGEAEALLPAFVEHIQPHSDRQTQLKTLCRQVAGAYVPAFYRAVYGPDGLLADFLPLFDAPPTVRRAYVRDLSRLSTCSTLLTDQCSFPGTYLVEVARGCPHGCRFCSAGFIYRPPRFRPLDLLQACLREGLGRSRRIGLMGAAVSDHPAIGQLCRQIQARGGRAAFSSLRADALSPDILEALKTSATRTATIAPDAGSERLRRVINKGIGEADILDAAERLVGAGIPNLKLYFMLGLPTETDDDVAAIATLCQGIKRQFLSASRVTGKMGTITVSLNSFVPKPWTPFQWAAMQSIPRLRANIERLRRELRSVANVRLNAENPRRSYIQALLSRGDRRVADVLLRVHQNNGNWTQSLKSFPRWPDRLAAEERRADEVFPWDFIDQGIRKDFLWREYQRALQGRATPDCPMQASCQVCGACSADGSAL